MFSPGIIASAPVIEFATFYDTKPVLVGNVRKFEGVLDQAKAKGDVDVDEYLGGVWGEGVFFFLSFFLSFFGFGQGWVAL